MNEEMRDKLERVYCIGCDPVGGCSERCHKYYKEIIDQILSLETKDYRIAVIKKGEPPLLTEKEIAMAKNCILEEDWVDFMQYVRGVTQEEKDVAQAQLDACLEYYKGGDADTYMVLNQ